MKCFHDTNHISMLYFVRLEHKTCRLKLKLLQKIKKKLIIRDWIVLL